MILISYDFENDKTRAKFSKFLKKFGRKIQYSVYEIKNSDRILKNILVEIDENYAKKITGADSVIILQLCRSCVDKIIRYGYSMNDDADIIIFE